nr:hypothetical protein [Legionellales bacterium]
MARACQQFPPDTSMDETPLLKDLQEKTLERSLPIWLQQSSDYQAILVALASVQSEKQDSSIEPLLERSQQVVQNLTNLWQTAVQDKTLERHQLAELATVLTQRLQHHRYKTAQLISAHHVGLWDRIKMYLLTPMQTYRVFRLLGEAR